RQLPGSVQGRRNPYSTLMSPPPKTEDEISPAGDDAGSGPAKAAVRRGRPARTRKPDSEGGSEGGAEIFVPDRPAEPGPQAPSGPSDADARPMSNGDARDQQAPDQGAGDGRQGHGGGHGDWQD